MAVNQLDFYRARAEQARADAEAATLDNVRDRCRRSQEAWQILADRAERHEKLRDAEAKRKAAEPPKGENEHLPEYEFKKH